MTLDGLVLRAWTTDAADVDFLLDMYSRPEVQRFIGRRPVLMRERDQALALVERWAGLAEGVLGVRALETPAGARLGSILLKRIPWSGGEASETPQDIEIGWHLHPDAWGHGYASTGAKKVLAEAWRAGLERVVAVTNPANLASQRVCARIGMTALGQTDRYYDVVCEAFEMSPPAKP